MQQNQDLAKRPSRVIDLEDRRYKVKEKKQTNYNYGKLNIEHPEKTNKKLALRTFFGNPESEVFCMKFSEDDGMIASGNSDGSIKIFNLQTGKLMHNLQGSTGSQQTPTTGLVWKPNTNGKLLYTVNADGSLVTWSTGNGQFIEKTVEKNQILAIDIKADGTKFATAGKDQIVRIYDDETQKVELEFPPQEYEQLGHSNRIFNVKFIKDQPNILLTGGWDSTVMIWDIRDRKAVDSINGPNLSGTSLDYKNGQILTGSYRNHEQIELYDFKTRKKLRDIPWALEGKTDKVYCYCSQFSKQEGDNTIMAGVTGDNALRIFDGEQDFNPAASVMNMHEGIYACDYANTSNKLAFAGGEGVVYIMSLSDTRE